MALVSDVVYKQLKYICVHQNFRWYATVKIFENS